ncbi:MAG: DUF2235 domain-containing protein, partial [Pseudomonadota bacterium]
LVLDERRSNIYKMFRATRAAPDNSISPEDQIAFYDPGLGSSKDVEHIRVGFGRPIYNVLAKATGLGITKNIVDCYASILQVWEPGDRIYLFGFSRGAYTIRCVGGVLYYCGVPTAEDGKPIKRDRRSAERLARKAVQKVYQHGLGKPKESRFTEQREELAGIFRSKYGCQGEEGSNAAPHFMGVFDTVAALGLSLRRTTALVVLALLLLWPVLSIPWLLGWTDLLFDISYARWIIGAMLVTAVGAAAIYFAKHVKWVSGLSVSPLKTLHLRPLRVKFYDNYLDSRVKYAKHAISIDEDRKDFQRVKWWPRDDAHVAKADKWFEQIWFAGVHSDIGGSYPETESRLSDITLEWMVERATNAAYPLQVDRSFLQLYPDPASIQHDERKSTWFARTFGWAVESRKVPDDAPLHPSVVERFEAENVVHYDESKPYRPEPLRTHQQVKHLF